MTGDKIGDNIELMSKMFWLFGSETRLKIINQLLYHGKLKMVDIAKNLELSPQVVQRPIYDLADKGMVERDSNGYVALTFYCKAVCINLSYLDFISKNKKYFEKHDFGDIPLQFIQRIGVLNNTIRIGNHQRILEKWHNMYRNTEAYIYNTFHEAEYSKEIMDVLLEKLEKEIKTKTIFSKESMSLFPDNHPDIARKFSRFRKSGQIEKRLKNKVTVSVVMTDKESMVMFPRIGENVDINEAFYSDDKDFHKWCLDYFNHCWDEAA